MDKIAEMKLLKYFLLIFLCMMTKLGRSQKTVDSLTQQNEAVIDVKFVVGFWETIDTPKNKIEFVDFNGQIILKTQSTFQPYYFSKDAQNNVHVSGYSPNWPPFHCVLKLVDSSTLKISWSQLGVTPTTIRYVKVKEQVPKL